MAARLPATITGRAIKRGRRRNELKSQKVWKAAVDKDTEGKQRLSGDIWPASTFSLSFLFFLIIVFFSEGYCDESIGERGGGGGGALKGWGRAWWSCRAVVKKPNNARLCFSPFS